MTLQQLEYIVALNKHRHFAKAADSCHVTQPTLSAMIQKLEDELKVRIFDRSSQPIKPTDIGAVIIRQAQQTIIEAERISDISAQYRHSKAGRINIGILPTIAPYLLPRFLPDFIDNNPDIDVHISEMKTSAAMAALQTGDIDAAIIADVGGQSGTIEHELFFEQFYAYVSRQSKLFEQDVVRTADLHNERLWLLDEGHCFRNQLLRFCQMEGAQQSRSSFSMSSIDTFMHIVENGRGITFVTELAVELLAAERRELVRRFALPSPTRRIVMLTNINYARTSLIESIVNAIRACVPPKMLVLRPGQVRV